MANLDFIDFKKGMIEGLVDEVLSGDIPDRDIYYHLYIFKEYGTKAFLKMISGEKVDSTLINILFISMLSFKKNILGAEEFKEKIINIAKENGFIDRKFENRDNISNFLKAYLLLDSEVSLVYAEEIEDIDMDKIFDFINEYALLLYINYLDSKIESENNSSE